MKDTSKRMWEERRVLPTITEEDKSKVLAVDESGDLAWVSGGADITIVDHTMVIGG